MRISLMRAIPLLAAALTLRSTFAAPLGEHFSPADADAYVEAAVRSLGDPESSVKDRDYAVRLLQALERSSVASGYKSSACSAVAAGLTSGDLERIHHGISLSGGVGGCTTAKTWRASEQVAAALEKKHDLTSLHHATLAAPMLGVDMPAERLLDKVLDLIQSDGSVRSVPGGPIAEGNAVMAAELLAALVPAAKGDAKAIAIRVVESLKEDVLLSEPTLLVPLNRARGEKLVLKAAKLKSMARDLLDASHTSRPKSMLGIYEALKTIESYPKAPLPIKLSPSSPSVEEMSSGAVGFSVTTLLGNPVDIKDALLSKLTRADGSDALASSEADGLPLASPNAEGVRSLPAVEVPAGLYTAEFSVEVGRGEQGKALTAKLPIAVGSAAMLAEARVSVSESKKSATALHGSDGGVRYVLAPGETLPDDAQASTLDGHYVHVGLSLKGGAAATPHQVFVRFSHAITGLATFFVAAPVGSNGSSGGNKGGDGTGEFAVSVSLGEESATFLQRSGAYNLAILVGGPLVTPPVEQELGAIDLDFPVTKSRDWPIYARALLHETDVSLGPLPEKHHTFREPEVRPHAGVSLLFTVLVLVPLGGLVYGMQRGGADLGKLPKSGGGKAWCAAYQACMVSIVLLFVTYWLTLTMAYTLKVLAVLSLVTTITGRKALQALALEAEDGGGSGQKGAKRNDDVHQKEE